MSSHLDKNPHYSGDNFDKLEDKSVIASQHKIEALLLQLKENYEARIQILEVHVKYLQYQVDRLKQ